MQKLVSIFGVCSRLFINSRSISLGTAYITHSDFLKHDTGDYHPECSDRLKEIDNELQNAGIWTQLIHHSPKIALLEDIYRVHTKEYVEQVRSDIEDGSPYLSTGDTPICHVSWQAALRAAGAGVDAVDLLMSGRARNVFCSVRPPGHHAEPAKGMGFCIFNNIAIAAKYAMECHKIKRVLIVDWDYHHGNGTQAAFWCTEGIMQFHTHCAGAYPGTGYTTDIGEGPAKGNIINVPLKDDTPDKVLEEIYVEKLIPSALKFAPQLMLVSAGFDGHKDDPLGTFSFTEEGFASFTKILKYLAKRTCQDRMILFLEGGYNLEAQARSVSEVLKVMMQ